MGLVKSQGTVIMHMYETRNKTLHVRIQHRFEGKPFNPRAGFTNLLDLQAHTLLYSLCRPY